MKEHTRGFLYLLLTIFLFSSYEVTSRLIGASANPFQLSFVRFLIGGGLLFFFLVLRRDVFIKRADLLKSALLGVLIVGVSMNLLQAGLSLPNAKASRVALLFSGNPIFVTVFAILIGREKPGPRLWAGLGLSALGLAVFFLKDLREGFGSSASDLLTLASAVSFGLHTYLARRVSVSIGSLKMNAYSFLAGSIAMIPAMLFFKVPFFALDPEDLPAILYLSVFITGLAYFMYFKGLAIVGAGKGSLVFFIKPVIAAVLARVVLGESLSVTALVGAALILCGIAVSSFRSA